MRHSQVCAVEWDGARYIGVTIDIFCYVFEVRPGWSGPRIHRALQRYGDGWIGPGHREFIVSRRCYDAAMEHASVTRNLFEAAGGRSIFDSPARQLFYDPDHEVFDYRQQLAAMLDQLVGHLDMDRHTHRA